MEYKEINRTETKIINTLIEFTFNINGKIIIKEISISHFNPKSKEDILEGIKNRFISEERDLLNSVE